MDINHTKSAFPLDQVETPSLQSVLKTKTDRSAFAAGTIDESQLTEEECKTIDQIASEISVANVEQVANYGVKAQTNISEFSTAILKKVRTYDLGEVGESLRDLTIALDATIEPEKKGLFRIFQRAKRSVGAIRANYAKAENNVDRIERDLKRHCDVLTEDIAVYQQLYDLNVQFYRELTLYIIAGKKALAKAKAETLQELKCAAETSNKQENIQAYRDFEDLCHRFEKKISDLEITRVISMQSAPQVRLLQNNDREMLDKLQSSLVNTIPLWRNQLVLSLGIEHSSRALSAQRALTDKTNELLAQNSEMLKIASIETAKQAERPIVDITVLQKCNKDLIASIHEVVKIHEEGNKQRLTAHDELVKIEEELKQTMLTAQNS